MAEASDRYLEASEHEYSPLGLKVERSPAGCALRDSVVLENFRTEDRWTRTAELEIRKCTRGKHTLPADAARGRW